jgi:hypothetical protein
MKALSFEQGKNYIISSMVHFCIAVLILGVKNCTYLVLNYYGKDGEVFFAFCSNCLARESAASRRRLKLLQLKSVCQK